MNKKQLLLACVAIAAYVLGAVCYVSATHAHVWHILAVPTYVVTAALFVIANIALTLLYGPQKGYASMMMLQGTVLGIAMLGANLVLPMCWRMATGLMYPTIGMIALGFFIKLATLGATSFRLTHSR